MKDPAFLFYTKDFISGTQDFSCEEVGIYLRLLMFQHQHGKIPFDKERMMRICGYFDSEKFDKCFDVIKGKFIIDGNHMVNERLTTEVENREKYKPQKIVSSIFAGLISANKLTKDQKDFLKKRFIIKDFIKFDDKEKKEKIKEWFTTTLNHMVNQEVNYLANANANADVIVNENKSFLNIDLSAEIFKNLNPDFALEIQSCISGRMPIILNKEIAGKKNTYFQLLKNLPSFQQTIKHQSKPLETNQAFEIRIDLLIKNWLQEQRDGKIEQSWTTLSDFAQHALNYIRLQENKSKNGNNGNSQQNARPSKGFVETKDNDYNSIDWGKPLGH